MRFVDCTHGAHAAQILAVFNEAIAHSTALFDYQPRTAESMVGWFAAKAQGGFPVIGIEDEAGALMAFASYGPFRAWPAYKYTVEHSVYVHRDHRGKGLGRRVMGALIERAKAQGLHVMVGGIEAGNSASIALHQALGFAHAGTVRHAGYKFGRWLDPAFYQLLLPAPPTPTED